ncbi:DUF202 domain-containing protein [Acidithiobacillus thiooxidans]|uniref:DUF202 domain-containing protein n=1 Tax=Acidithiobacillus thiooxidans ATCC 19377 TaxID=637390 RepID=A0A5P9XQ57_ACITH|nr:DUF202 domain-containing protein [Acidithiobacillus thiooxidans]MBU2842821.1 DUF202 domain-containing protein [Acidithiobacillus thiooxidans]QFX95840.1 hypothetical protein GCD22_01485 [Acidithiobacillus thiooxidans ATCC 19377]
MIKGQPRATSAKRWHFRFLDAHRHHFHRYPKSKLVLRDWLALDRTAAANRRTFYSFLRTTLDFNISGLVLIRFFGYSWVIAIGALFILISGFTGGYALYRFMSVRQHYRQFLLASENFKPSALTRVER